MSVVASGGFVFDVAHRDGDRLRFIANRSTLRNISIALELRQTFGSLNCKNCRRCGRLTMVDVANRPDVYVRLGALKNFLRHLIPNLASLV